MQVYHPKAQAFSVLVVMNLSRYGFKVGSMLYFEQGDARL